MPEVGREGLVCGEGVGGKGDRASVMMDKEDFKIGEEWTFQEEGTYQQQYFENPGGWLRKWSDSDGPAHHPWQ